MNKQRLLNAAKAVRESPSPEAFSMSRYGSEPVRELFREHGCGTPGCVLGHYASRTDIQDEFKLVGMDIFRKGAAVPAGLWERRVNGLTYNGREICDHFAITIAQATELFSISGCGYAQTPAEAAEFIERFIVRGENL